MITSFVRGGSKFDLWFRLSVHFCLIYCWRLGDYWFFSWRYWKYPNFQLVIVKNLIFSCRENDRKMTNRYPWAALCKIKGAFSEIPSLIVSIAQQQQRQQRKVLTMHRNHKRLSAAWFFLFLDLILNHMKGDVFQMMSSKFWIV